ncbi:MAG TPA: LuxR C-terminal-related transcriptional regulator [Pirellulales bacterium]|jgi:DNA-binding CsgD family transcriptional regulator|nr:LuxR C-terminal-related transcriptional regulator [Pirellulales bacterium]
MSSYLDALWSAASGVSERVPDWFRSLVAWNTQRLPANVQEDFLSLVAIELLEQKCTNTRELLRDDVQRALGRVRQRLLAEIGYSARFSHRRSSPLTSDPKVPESNDPLASLDIREFLKSVLTPQQMLVLSMQLEGRNDREISKKLGVSSRTIQRIRRMITQILSRAL